MSNADTSLFMSGRPCPECQRPDPRLLEALSRDALVLYYRCAGCAHIWHVWKSDPDGPQRSNIETPQRSPNV